MMTIGLLSDTHGWLDPQIPGLFAGCTEIWHGGDFGSVEVISELRQVAPRCVAFMAT